MNKSYTILAKRRIDGDLDWLGERCIDKCDTALKKKQAVHSTEVV